jgi:hypothetical protein
MKKFFFVIAALVLSISSFAFNPVNEKLIRSFESNFPNASQVTWQELESGFIVNFVREGIRSRATFDAEGNLLQVVRYYHEQHLPYDLRYRVKRIYPQKQIFGVIEITTTKDSAHIYTEYLLKLEDNKSWTTLRITASGKALVVDRLLKE